MATSPLLFRPRFGRILRRPPSAEPGGKWIHSHRWRKARLRHLRANPLCVECRRRGRETPATQVDHKRPHRGDYELFWDEMNWQSLCATHHSRKTVREDGGFGRKRVQRAAG